MHAILFTVTINTCSQVHTALLIFHILLLVTHSCTGWWVKSTCLQAPAWWHHPVQQRAALHLPDSCCTSIDNGMSATLGFFAGKKCLVLDIDYTLFDLNSSAERPDELARPYLHEFLTACYEYYDILIWSATNMKWVEVRCS